MVADRSLKRQLGLAAVAALVVGDMLGSGVFFTPGELAAVARHPWQVYFVWTLCGLITLCGALTLAELCGRLPHAGASFHIIREGFGPFWAFLKVWMELWVAGPGSVAGVAIVFGEYAHRMGGLGAVGSPAAWGVAAIAFFAAINLAGVVWGGRTQVTLTTIKVVGILALIGGSLFLAQPAGSAPAAAAVAGSDGLLGFFRFAGLGIAAVLFTYDGWVDVSHVAGEVRRPERNLPIGLGLGVAGLTALYLIVNYGYLRVVPLETMRAAPTAIASTVATGAFGPVGGQLVNVLILISIFGALGGLVMTLPRLFYTLAATHLPQATGPLRLLFRGLASVATASAAPVGAILFTAVAASAALLFFGSFSRVVNFFVVPAQVANILIVMSIFQVRRATPAVGYRTPGYPLTPIVYAVVLTGFLVSALVFRPTESIIGLALTASGAPVYRWLARGQG
jgi:APA family basic amino acid/polyamine antiporter